MKNFFLTLDLEEWYHLEYLNTYSLKKEDLFINKLQDFFSLLDKYSIKATIFVLAELAEKHKVLIKSISDRGHEIACHGFDHDLLYNKSDNDFREQIKKAKDILENAIGRKIYGYRASCFSMNRKKLEIVKELGYKYDSSLIKFNEHSLYTPIDMSGYEKIDDLIYRNNQFFEIEIPTLKISKYNIPISGGGYFRIFPKRLFSFFFKKYMKNSKNFNFYIHPFEVAYPNFKLKKVSFKDKLRFSIGRKNNLRNLDFFLSKISKEYRFITINEYLTELENK